MRHSLTLLALLFGFRLFAAEVMPPAPALYFNDYANVTTKDAADQLNQTLESFAKATSSQIVVAVFPKMQTDSSIEDYTIRIFRAWKVGQKDKNNGAALFVFIQDRKMFLQVGYGLEGVLPDALCKRIIEDEIKPRFKSGDYNGGLTAGVAAILAAAKGEYHGTGRTVTQGRSSPAPDSASLITGIFVILFVLFLILKLRRTSRGGGWIISSGGGGGAGGSW